MLLLLIIMPNIFVFSVIYCIYSASPHYSAVKEHLKSDIIVISVSSKPLLAFLYHTQRS